MQPSLCSRCGKNPAVVFITKLEAGQTKNEGLCLKCARELHIKPVDDMIQKLGLTDEDLDSFSGNMLNAMNGVEELMSASEGDEENEDDEGKTATFPFLNRLFGGPNAPQNQQPGNNERPREGGKELSPAAVPVSYAEAARLQRERFDPKPQEAQRKKMRELVRRDGEQHRRQE